MTSEPDINDYDVVFFSLLYSSVTLLFAMAVLSKFLTNEFRFGFRAIVSLLVLFIGEPLCQFLVKGHVGVATFACGCLFVYTLLPANHMKGEKKCVVITGCDSGFGYALVKKLDGLNMVIFAGCLSSESAGATKLKDSCSERVHVLQLDVTKPEDVTLAVQYVRQHIDVDEGLWGLVNNAGICCLSQLDWTPEVVFEDVMNVNLMGTVRVTRAFLPMVKQAKGRIVNMSSLVGRVAMECSGAYCVSKQAIEAYTDVLRKEMRPHEVKVCSIEPTGYFTGACQPAVIQANRDKIWNHLEESFRTTEVEEQLDRLYSNIKHKYQELPSDIVPVVKAMRSALLSRRPLYRYPVGMGARSIMNTLPLLPVWLTDKITSLMAITSD